MVNFKKLQMKRNYKYYVNVENWKIQTTLCFFYFFFQQSEFSLSRQPQNFVFNFLKSLKWCKSNAARKI